MNIAQSEKECKEVLDEVYYITRNMIGVQANTFIYSERLKILA